MKPATSATFSSSGHSLEVTGLGVIAALLIAFGCLVSDGTLPLSQYLVFFVFLLAGAGTLAWRIFKLAPTGAAKPDEPRQPAI